jgi:hypothetical protein
MCFWLGLAAAAAVYLFWGFCAALAWVPLEERTYYTKLTPPTSGRSGSWIVFGLVMVLWPLYGLVRVGTERAKKRERLALEEKQERERLLEEWKKR